MIYLLVLFPLLMAGVTYSVPSNRWRPWCLPLGGTGHLALVMTAVFAWADHAPLAGLDGWLLLDPLGKLFLAYLSVLFFLCSLYAPGYLALRGDRDNRVICTNLFASLSVMTLVTISQHLGLMWVAMEATTLVTSPSIYFNHNARSL
jgi:hydrogenase-4 component F